MPRDTRTMTVLRRICGRFGDNHWDERTPLLEILENHLENHLVLALGDGSPPPAGVLYARGAKRSTRVAAPAEPQRILDADVPLGGQPMMLSGSGGRDG